MERAEGAELVPPPRGCEVVKKGSSLPLGSRCPRAVRRFLLVFVSQCEQGWLMEVLQKEVRSLLMATKQGLSPEQLEQEYAAMVGRPLPLRDLGFRSTMELVAEMPKVVRVCPNGKGSVVLKGEASFPRRVFGTARREEAVPQNTEGLLGAFPELWVPSLLLFLTLLFCSLSLMFFFLDLNLLCNVFLRLPLEKPHMFLIFVHFTFCT